ncbi:MAG: hypothetical protein LBM98_13390 [Oscillospiraceae bacterium]|nr:hypothetical protein [Oscillospiraceae bacterium]
MLRTCNVVRIAGFPALRKDGARRRDGGRGTGDGAPGRGRAGLKPAPTSPAQTFVQTPVSDI